MSARPLSEGNRFQRWYHAWAAPRYACMPADVRDQAETIDRFLYSRRGLGVWAGLLCGFIGTVAGLIAAGVPTTGAVLLGFALWVALPIVTLGAWVSPRSFLSPAKLLRFVGLVGAGAVCGALFGMVGRHLERHGELVPGLLAQEVVARFVVIAPPLLLAIGGFFFIVWSVARVRRQLLERELHEARLLQERDAAARQAAEARLKLLQGQIQPHFIFNTLAALQHWVDTGDARAPALLRTLTGFLRGSTELLGRDSARLADEVEIARQYLAIMQARLGERLRFTVEVEPGCGAALLPPGLLLTLVENAVEHGIAPALAGGTVQVSAVRADGTLRLCVSDDGAGLAPDWADGTGLGNCRERLRHHGDGRGTITMTALTPGTRACIVLPEAKP